MKLHILRISGPRRTRGSTIDARCHNRIPEVTVGTFVARHYPRPAWVVGYCFTKEDFVRRHWSAHSLVRFGYRARRPFRDHSCSNFQIKLNRLWRPRCNLTPKVNRATRFLADGSKRSDFRCALPKRLGIKFLLPASGFEERRTQKPPSKRAARATGAGPLVSGKR